MFTAIAALLILVWVQQTRKPWRELGFVQPGSWPATIALGVVSGVLLKLVMKSIVMPLLGAPANNPVYQFVAGNPGALLGMIFVSIVIAGFGEELIYRCFLFDRLGKLLGQGAGARIATVVLTSALFAALHLFDQGRFGAEQALIMGLVYGSIYARTRSLWLPMILHAAFDLTAVFIIYLGLESSVAHLLVR